jgi:hypothetical protein
MFQKKSDSKRSFSNLAKKGNYDRGIFRLLQLVANKNRDMIAHPWPGLFWERRNE